MGESFVTLLTNDGYAIGAIVLARSIRESGSSKAISVLVTDNVSKRVREKLSVDFDNIISVEEIDSRDRERLQLLGRPELGPTLTKIHIWRLLQFNKVVFLDADTLVLQNVDELFSREEDFLAAPDVGWPDCFNSGVFVCRPNLDTYHGLYRLALTTGSFDGKLRRVLALNTL